MQCKDIPTLPILEFIVKHGGIGCNWYKDSDMECGINTRSVRHAMPNGEELPNNLVLAKMRSLVDHKYITGCGCGCRGDFEMLNKGYRALGYPCNYEECYFNNVACIGNCSFPPEIKHKCQKYFFDKDIF